LSTLLIIGATSGIAQAYTSLVASRYKNVALVARDTVKLEHVAAHVKSISDAQVHTFASDLGDSTQQEKLVADVLFKTNTIDQALISYGQLTEQERCAGDINYAMQQFHLNGTSTISLSMHITRQMAVQGSGTLSVVGSVAGDRGRRSNYCYGAAKGAVDAFLSGLRSDMQSRGVHVLTIKPGFVDTPMTASFKKGALWASAEKVAVDIDRASTKKKNVLYTPWFWRYIMLIIKWIPEWIFKKLPL